MSESTPLHIVSPEEEFHPTTTRYQELAAAFMESLDGLVASALPDLESPHPLKTDFVRSHVNVPFDFLWSAIAAVEDTPDLQAIERLDVERARSTLQFIEAFRPVADRLASLVASLRFTLASRKADLAGEAFQIYSIAKGLSRAPRGAEVAARVEFMRRDLGRAGRPSRRDRGSAQASGASASRSAACSST